MSILMIKLFVIGLKAARAAGLIVLTIKIVSGKWLHEIIKDKLKNKKNHKAVIINKNMAYHNMSEDMKKKIDNSDEISFEEFEKVDDEIEFVSVLVDEDDNFTDYEFYNAEQYDEKFQTLMKQEKGILVVGCN